MFIIMLGAQGTGKGTVAGILSQGLNIPQISTGDIFRKNISENTELGIEAQKYMSKGYLVPDDITVPMVENRLKENDTANGAILDGFPRTIEQAEKLNDILAKDGKKIDLVINLETPREEIIERMLNRRVCINPDCKEIYNTKLHPPKVEGICDKCGSPIKLREDDSDPKSIEKRLELYEEKTSPLVQFYKNMGVLRTETVSTSINRMGSDVAKDIISDINN